MRKSLWVLGLAFAVIGCSSTGVVSTGENEYLVSKTDVGDTWSEGSKVLAKLYQEGNAFCAKKGLVLERISEETQDGKTFVHNASATLRFRCVAKSR